MVSVFSIVQIDRTPGFQASTYSVSQWPSSSKITSQASGFEQRFFYILYKNIEKMHNLTSWASKKLLQAVVFERQALNHDI